MVFISHTKIDKVYFLNPSFLCSKDWSYVVSPTFESLFLVACGLAENSFRKVENWNWYSKEQQTATTVCA